MDRVPRPYCHSERSEESALAWKYYKADSSRQKQGARNDNPCELQRAVKQKGSNPFGMEPLNLSRQRPTLPHTYACSTIGPAGLNFRVRDGNGWNPRGMVTDNLRRLRGVRAACRN